MSNFICPVCKGALDGDGRRLFCRMGHSYDISRGGYVNLLMSNKSGDKRHGDDALMVKARSAFLEKGYYEPLRRLVCELALIGAGTGMSILDCGCGDGWYLRGLMDSLSDEGIAFSALGIDISRDALKAAQRRCPEASFAVASVAAIPVATASCGLLLNIFSPEAAPEFRRALAREGYVLRVTPMKRHLYSLKKAVYDIPRENDAEPEIPEGFSPVERRELRYEIALNSQQDIANLFAMTPYYYKTSEKDQEKLSALSALSTEAEFLVELLIKR